MVKKPKALIKPAKGQVANKKPAKKNHYKFIKYAVLPSCLICFAVEIIILIGNYKSKVGLATGISSVAKLPVNFFVFMIFLLTLTLFMLLTSVQYIGKFNKKEPAELREALVNDDSELFEEKKTSDFFRQ